MLTSELFDFNIMPNFPSDYGLAYAGFISKSFDELFLLNVALLFSLT